MDQLPDVPREATRCKRLRLTVQNHRAPGGGKDIEGLIAAQMADNRKTIEVTYDVRITALENLVFQLCEQGMSIAMDRRARIFIAWQSYLDRNARANLTHPGSPCCSNPTSVYASRKKR